MEALHTINIGLVDKFVCFCHLFKSVLSIRNVKESVDNIFFIVHDFLPTQRFKGLDSKNSSDYVVAEGNVSQTVGERTESVII